MSAEPGSSDSLSQLKELMLGEEKRELAELRERLEELDEASSERLACDLVAALHRRREMGVQSFDDLVAALQPGTEFAIQKSVNEDKSKLSKALFPIMGPAIRNYVVDLFRGMVEELNETIRNTTSAERIKWRVQAKMAGKSYSEFVLLKTRSFYTEEVYLIQRDTGLLLLHANRNPEEEANGEADLVSGMFTAIRSFVRDSFARDETGDDGSELDSFTFGEREVLVEVGPAMVIAAVAFGVPPPSAKDTLKEVLEDLHAELVGRLGDFSGDMAQLEIGRPTLRRALMESRATDTSSNGGGMWRAWVALGFAAVAIGVVSFFGMQEQKRWNGFVEALRDEPGIAVTSVENDGWWRHRTVRGLRDPLAKDPSQEMTEHGIDPEKATLAFDSMASMDPLFTERREALLEKGQNEILQLLESLQDDLGKTVSAEDMGAIKKNLDEGIAALEAAAVKAEDEQRAALGAAVVKAEDAQRAALEAAAVKVEDAQKARDRQLVETLVQSQFAGIDGLVIEFDSDTGTARFSGALDAEEYRAVSQRIVPLRELIEVDVSGLSEDSSLRLARVIEEIEGLQIRYLSGSLDAGDQENVSRMETLSHELDKLASSLNLAYRFEVIAHPLIGANRAANRRIESRRAEQVRDGLIAAGIAADRIKTGLSEDTSRAGEGVSLMAKKVEEEPAEP